MAPRTTDQLLDELERIGRRGGRRSSYAEYRSGRRASDESRLAERAFWAHVTAPRQLEVAEKRALSKATVASGAALVPTDFGDRIIEALNLNGPLGRLSSEFLTESGSDLPVPLDTAQGSAAWVAESGAGAASDETFGQVTFKAFRATSSVVVSEELLADSRFELDVFLAAKLGKRLALLEESAFAVGDGAGKPTGILPAVSVVTAASGNSTSFDWVSIVSLAFALPAAYRANASFVMSDGIAKALRGLKDAAGLPLWTGEQLLGYPVAVSPDMPGHAHVLRGDDPQPLPDVVAEAGEIQLASPVQGITLLAAPDRFLQR